MNLATRVTQVTTIYDLLYTITLCAESNTRIVSPMSLKIILVEAHNCISTLFLCYNDLIPRKEW